MMIENFKSRLFALLAVLTIGFPFVGYKVLFGLLLQEMYGTPLSSAVAFFFAGWGIVDLIFKAAQFYKVVGVKAHLVPVCVLSAVVRKCRLLKKYDDAGEAMDVMLSFMIVAIVVGGGLFKYMDASQLEIWNACTVVNVLGAGIARLGTSITNNRKP